MTATTSPPLPALLAMSAARSGASVRSAGVRRLLQEAKELERDDCADYAAAPLEVRRSARSAQTRWPGHALTQDVYRTISLAGISPSGDRRAATLRVSRLAGSAPCHANVRTQAFSAYRRASDHSRAILTL